VPVPVEAPAGWLSPWVITVPHGLAERGGPEGTSAATWRWPWAEDAAVADLEPAGATGSDSARRTTEGDVIALALLLAGACRETGELAEAEAPDRPSRRPER
jgi:hypothetical protein